MLKFYELVGFLLFVLGAVAMIVFWTIAASISGDDIYGECGAGALAVTALGVFIMFFIEMDFD